MSLITNGTNGNYLSRSVVMTGVADLTMSIRVAPTNLPGSGQDTLFYNGNAGSNGYGIQLLPSGVTRILRGGTEVGPTGTTVLSTGQWRTITMTRSGGGSWLLYVGNVQDASDASGGAGTPSGSTLIGASSGSADTSDAWFANACMWNVGLTVEEITMIEAGVSPLLVRPESLVAYWPLWEHQSGVSIDYSTSKAHMTVNGTISQSRPPQVMPWALPIETQEVALVVGDSATVYLDLQPLVTEEYPVVPLRFTVTGQEEVQTYNDAATVVLDLSVQGGECYSTAMIVAEGEAITRFTAIDEDVNARFYVFEDNINPRFSATVQRSGVAC